MDERAVSMVPGDHLIAAEAANKMLRDAYTEIRARLAAVEEAASAAVPWIGNDHVRAELLAVLGAAA